MSESFRATVLRKHEVGYWQCPQCLFLQTSSPYWLEEAYGSAIADADTGLLQRNISVSAKLASLLYFCLEPKGAFVDVAGGFGTLVRLMRDLGFDFYWEDKYCENLLARGFEADRKRDRVTAITGFEVLEHVEDPVSFLTDAFVRYGTRTIVFTTELYEGTEPPSREWWYYAFQTGQHISFYHKKTLANLAKRLNLRFRSANGIHLFTDRQLRRPWLFDAVTSRLSFATLPYVRHKLGSRTLADHTAMLLP